MFLNKIDLAYCLVVFFVVCRVSGCFEVFSASKCYLGVQLLKESQERRGRTVTDGVSVARGK